MKNYAKFLMTLMICVAAVTAGAQDIIMGQAATVGGIQEMQQHFYDPGGKADPNNVQNPEGKFATNTDVTMTLEHSLNNNYVLYVLFDDFVLGDGDTLWIYDGPSVNSTLLGVYNLVNSPYEVKSTGKELTFRFKSDDYDDPGLSSGWVARVSAYLKDESPKVFKMDQCDGTQEYTCNAKFYDSGGENGTIKNNNENYIFTVISSAGTHIKCEFTQFSCNGVMKIYDGYVNAGMPDFDPDNPLSNGRLIGQFCTSTLDGSTNNKPPVLFSSGEALTFIYVGTSGDKQKAGWAADITCVPLLSTDLYDNVATPCPGLRAAPGGIYADSVSDVRNNYHVVDYSCDKPVMVFEADVMASGRYSYDYTIKRIPEAMEAGYRQIDYAQVQGTTQVSATEDDAWLSPIQLPFKFNFFGKTYQTIYPGTNGLISMNSQTGYCYYSYPYPGTTPPYPPESVPYNPNSATSSPYRNAIYGVFEDIDCNQSHCPHNIAVRRGVVTIDQSCRAFVFNYNNIGLFGKGSDANNYNTYQMALYEGTNIIDVFVKKRKCCASTNSTRNEGVIGLHNNTSSQILIAPGRGMTGWEVGTGTNPSEGWRFTPITPLDEEGELAWYRDVIDDAHLLSYSEAAKNRKFAYRPDTTTLIISVYKYTNSAGATITVRDTTKINVKVPPISTSRSSGNSNICPNENCTITVTANTQGFPGVTPVHYQWSSAPTDTLQSATVSPSKTTMYYVTLTYNNGCTRYDSIKVDVTDLQNPEINATDTMLCVGESATLVASHPTNNNFKWSTGATTPSITISPLVTTQYKVETEMAGGCIVNDTITVVVNPLPKPAFIATPTEIFVENGIGTVTCEDISPETYALTTWNFGDFGSGTNIVQNVSMATHDYIKSGFYTITLTAEDGNGCRDSIKNKVSVTVPYFFYIPNAFTPSKDGRNEKFAPQGAGVDPDNYSMEIYDRNGMIIFKTRNPYDYWDGKNKFGKECPDGIYVYVIRLRNLNGDDKEYTGTVTLLK